MAAPCFFPGAVWLGEERMDLFNRAEGTLEFWFKPPWSAVDRSGAADRHYFINMGPELPRRYTSHFKQILVIAHYPGRFYVWVGKESNAKWSAGGTVEDAAVWPGGRWHHLAVVWNAADPRDEWLRLYLDGRKVSGLRGISKPERFKDGVQIDVGGKAPYPVQVGVRNNGRYPADALIDELRISRVARYREDFEPATESFEMDPHTTALFHFDDDLTGQGTIPAGATYPVESRAGILSREPDAPVQ